MGGKKKTRKKKERQAAARHYAEKKHKAGRHSSDPQRHSAAKESAESEEEERQQALLADAFDSASKAAAGVSADTQLGSGIRGLQNLGNTCFLNSVLQCLAHLHPLRDMLLRISKSDISSGACGPFTRALWLFNRMMWHAKVPEAGTGRRGKARAGGASFAPSVVLKTLGAKYRQFRRGRQQDAQEALRFILDEVDEEARGSGSASIVAQLFGGELCSVVTCHACQHASVTTDRFFDVSVELRQEKQQQRQKQRSRSRKNHGSNKRGGAGTRSGSGSGSSSEAVMAPPSRKPAGMTKKEFRRWNQRYHAYLQRKHSGGDNSDAQKRKKKKGSGESLDILNVEPHAVQLEPPAHNFSDTLPSYSLSFFADDAAGAEMASEPGDTQSSSSSESEDDSETTGVASSDGEDEESTEVEEMQAPSPSSAAVAALTSKMVPTPATLRPDKQLYDARREIPSTSVVQAKQQSVLSCFALFTEPEPLNGDNRYACSHCRAVAASSDLVFRDASKQLLLKSLPLCLTIHLKRFRHTNRGFAKATSHVAFPFKLDVGKFCTALHDDNGTAAAAQSASYVLNGVVVHQGGGARSGHYIAYVREGETWYYCSDTQVRVVSEKEVYRTEAYLLFYVRQQQATV